MSALISTFGLDWRLLLTQAINFGVVLGVLWYLLYKPVTRILTERQEKIAAGIRAAEAAEAKAAKADDEAAKVVHGAEQEAEGIVAMARKSGTGERARIMKEAEARAASIERDSAARATEDAARVLRESEKEIARLAVLAAEKVLREKTS